MFQLRVMAFSFALCPLLTLWAQRPFPQGTFFDETQRLEFYIEEKTAPRYVYDAMWEAQFRELDNYYEALYENTRRMELQECQHRANLHNLTQAPVYFTRHGRCWHADPASLQRSSRRAIARDAPTPLEGFSNLMESLRPMRPMRPMILQRS